MDTEDIVYSILETNADANDNENKEEMRLEGRNQLQPKSLDPGLNNILQVFSKSSSYCILYDFN